MISFAQILIWAAVSVAPAELTRAERLFENGQHLAARKAVLAAWGRLPAASRADGVRLLRKVALQQGDPKGAQDFAVDEVALRIVENCQTDMCAVRLCDALEAGWYLNYYLLGAPELAAQWQLRYRHNCAHRPEERSRDLYIQGQVAMAELRLADAWASFQRAAHTAIDPIDRAHALLSLVESAARLGRVAAFRLFSEQAWTAVEMADVYSRNSGEQRFFVSFLTSIGWSFLRLREAGHDAGDPDKFLIPALGIVETRGLNFSAARARNLRINLALGAIQRGDAAMASRWLRRVDPGRLNPDEMFWLRLVQARGAIMRGAWHEAGRHVKAVEALAASAESVEQRCHASRLRGLLSESRGALAEAVAAYHQAEECLDTLTVSSALGQGRDHYIHDLQRGARRAIALQVRLGRIEEALCTLRMARTRVHRGLLGDTTMNPGFHERRRRELDETARSCRGLVAPEAREHCLADLENLRRALRGALDVVAAREPTATPNCEDLRSPEDDELFLAYMELDDGWVGIAADRMGAAAFRLGAIDPHAESLALSRMLLGPFDAKIAAAKHVLVLATQTLHDVDFHMLPWHQDALVAHATVAYALDLPRGAPSKARPGRAAVVGADPTASLSIHDEVHIVRSALEAAGLGAELLTGADAVRSEVMPLLGAHLSHFYLGGHAGTLEFAMPEASWLEPEDMWDIVLRLEENTVISVEDLLATVVAGGAPEVAVLMACKTGIVDRGTLSGGIGMAQAFLLRGSSAVIGSQEEIQDSVAYELTRALYDGWNPSLPFVAADRLASAQTELLRAGVPSSEVGRARVWVR